MKKYLSEHWKLLIILSVSIIFTLVVSSYLVIQKETSRVYTIDDAELANIAEDVNIGIVLGGGVGLDRPSTIVQDRLDTAKELLDKGYINKLILSGDNTYENYNEPQVMFDYLIQNGVSAEKLQRDFAGRSTYATCERAKKIFGVNSAFLISQDTHLPRAVYLCEHFNIDTYGVVAKTETRKRTWVYQRVREFFARGKAVFNVYIMGEETILGEPININ